MANIASLLIKIGVSEDGSVKVEQKIRGLRSQVKGLEKDVGGLKAAWQRMRDGADAFNEIRQAIGNVIGDVRAVFSAINEQIDAVGNLKDLAATVGLGVEEYQRLAFAASQSGVEQEKLSIALKTFNKNLLDVKQGGGKGFVDALNRIGLAVEDLEGKSRTEQIEVIADHLNSVEDAAKRSALAAELFGSKAGPALASLLAEGSAGIQALVDSTNGVFTQDQVDQAEAYGDQVAALERDVKVLAQGLALELLPALGDAVETVRDWIKETNAETAAVGEMGDAFRHLFHDVEAAVDGVELLIDGLGRMTGITPSVELLAEAVRAVGIEAKNSEQPLVDWGDVAYNALLPFLSVLGNIRDLFVELGGVAIEAEKGGFRVKGIDRLMSSQRAAARAAAPDKPFVNQGPAIGSGGPANKRGGAGGAGKKTAAVSSRAAAPELPPGITGEELIAAVQNGDLGALQERLKGIADRSPRVADVKPTVAMDIVITNVQVQQTINTKDGLAAGREATALIRQEIRKANAAAALALAGNIAR